MLVAPFALGCSVQRTGPAADETGATDTSSESESASGSSGETGEEQFCEECPTEDGTAVCRDRVDNDQDGLVDLADPDCLFPCDNSESQFDADPWGLYPATCDQNCFVDLVHDFEWPQGDECRSHQRCDPVFEPECWNPNPYPGACDEPTQTCLDTCLPAVPNGCDCFGCCELRGPNGTVTVRVHDSDSDGGLQCSSVDQTKCEPCTVREDCFNPCEPEACEWCFGELAPPPGCEEVACDGQTCTIGPDGRDDCEDPCAYCSYGCCVRTPVWD